MSGESDRYAGRIGTVHAIDVPSAVPEVGAMTRGRFSGHPYPGGIFVLDTVTGEVVKVPADGSGPVVLCPAVRPDREHDDARASTMTPAPRELAGPALGALDREVVSAFPYPIARTYHAYLHESDPRQRCKLLVDTFTQVLKLWSLMTASEYLASDDLTDVTVAHTLTRDFQRPLISAWNLLLARAIPALEAHGAEPMAPELWRAYRELESECRDNVVLETRYKDAAGAVKVRKSKLGRIQALIRYRNSLAHGYNQSRDKAEDDLRQFAPVLESVLEQARFSTRYPLFYVPTPRPGAPSRGGRPRALAATTHPVDAYRLMGARPSPTLEEVTLCRPLAPGTRFFVYEPATQRGLGLGVFFDVEDVSQSPGDSAHSEAIAGLGWDVLTFEGHTRTTMIYASVAGEMVEKQGRLDEWRALMAHKAVSGKAMTLDRLTWHGLADAAARITDETLGTLVQSGRYIPEVSISRPQIERLLDDFERSDQRGFVVAGEGGMGKTTLLCRYAAERRERGDLVLFYRAATLSDTRLAERVVRDLGVRNAFFEDFLAALASVVPEGKRVRVIVDSLHEHAHATAELVRAIDALVEQAASYPFVRVVTSIRTAAYERLPANARFGLSAPERYFTVEQEYGGVTRPSHLVDMPPFADDQVAEAYERYRGYTRPEDDEFHPGANAFRPLTPFAELAEDGATVALMRVPLFVRLLCAAFAHRPLPSDLSFDQAMEPYMEYVVVERGDAHGGYPERGRFLKSLVRLLDGISARSMARDQLYQVPTLAAHLRNAQKDSAYVQLLELGILIEDWDEDQCSVRFAQAGLFEYLLAELHYPRIDTPAALLALVERAMTFKSLRAAVVIIMRRAIRTERASLVMNACDLCTLDDQVAASDDLDGDDAGTLFVLMMRDLLVDLARFRDPAFDVLCREIPATASVFDIRVIFAAFDALFEMGEVQAADRLARLATAVARDLDADGLHAAALLRSAHVDMHRGQSDEVVAHLDRAEELSRASDSRPLLRRIDLLRARLLVTQGEHERAERIFDNAYREFTRSGELGEASVALRGLASIATRNGRLERAVGLGREAVELAERTGDRASLAKALNNLAITEKRRGDTESALQSLERSLAIKKEIGDRAGIATTALNLGALLLARGDLSAAHDRWRESLHTFEALEHTRGVALTLCNLGTLAHLRGESEAARAHLERSLELFRMLGDGQGVAHALWYLASLAADLDDLARTRVLLDEFGRMADAASQRNLDFQRSCLEVRIALRSDSTELEVLVHAVTEILRLSKDLDVRRWDVEDGPASTLLDAAQYAHRHAMPDHARTLVDRTLAVVDRRPYARASELMALDRAVA